MSPERRRLLVSVIGGVVATVAVVVLIGQAAHFAGMWSEDAQTAPCVPRR